MRQYEVLLIIVAGYLAAIGLLVALIYLFHFTQLYAVLRF